MVNITFGIDGGARDISAAMSGTQMDVVIDPDGGVHATALIPYGSHDVVIRWKDTQGNSYSATETIGIDTPSGVIAELPGQNGSSKLPCLPSAILLLVAGGLFLGFGKRDSQV